MPPAGTPSDGCDKKIGYLVKKIPQALPEPWDYSRRLAVARRGNWLPRGGLPAFAAALAILANGHARQRTPSAVTAP